MRPVLVDTSVWRRFFIGKTSRAQTQALGGLLDEDGAVLVHEAVLGELVLGGLSARQAELLQRLPRAIELPSGEVRAFVTGRKLMRRGIGWVDVHVLASAIVSSADLWSLDVALDTVARELGAAFGRPS